MEFWVIKNIEKMALCSNDDSLPCFLIVEGMECVLCLVMVEFSNQQDCRMVFFFLVTSISYPRCFKGSFFN